MSRKESSPTPSKRSIPASSWPLSSTSCCPRTSSRWKTSRCCSGCSAPAAEAYDSFCDEVENCLPFIFGASSSIRDLDPDANDEKRLLRGTIVAAVNKMYLDCCFVAMRQEQALWPGILGDLE